MLQEVFCEVTPQPPKEFSASSRVQFDRSATYGDNSTWGHINDWLTRYTSLQAVQRLLADIKSSRVSPSAVLLSIQLLSDEERREMADVLEVIFEAIRWVESFFSCL